MNESNTLTDTGGDLRPPFLVRKRTTFTWVIPILLLAASLGLHRDYGGWVFYGVGVLLILLGEIVRFWAAGYIAKDSEIATGGPSADVRNPLSFGSRMLALVFGLVSGFGLWAVGAMLAFYLLF